MRFAALLLFCAASAFGTTCGTGWAHSGTFTVHPPSGATAGVSTFPVRVIGAFSGHLNAAGGMVHASAWDHCYSDSGNTVAYPFAIFGYDATNGVNDAVQYPTLPATGSTVDVTVWWGKSGVTVDPSSTAVFVAGYFQYFPLQESGFNYLDKTSGATNLTTGTAGTRVAGLTSPNFAQSFNGSTQFLTGASAQTVGSIAFTTSALFKTSISGALQVIVDNRNTSQHGNALILNTGGVSFCFSDAVSGNILTDATNHSDGQWHQMTQTLSAAGLFKCFIDGALVSSVTQGTPTTFPASSSIVVATAVASLGASLTGQVGEFWGFSSDVTPSWVANSAANLLTPSSFLTFAATGGATDIVIVPGIL